MARRLREAGQGKIVRHFLSVGLTLCAGYVFGVSALGGCGSAASWPSNGKLPGPVVDELTDCGKKGPTPLESSRYDLAFTVHVADDEQEARVDDVMLTGSTLHLPEVEACMTHALYGMRAPREALALRRRRLSPDPSLPPEARALLGQAEIALLFEATVLLLIGYATYTVVVSFLVDKPHAKHRARPVSAEPDMPEIPIASAVPTVTAMPMATVAPTATAKPVATYVPMTPKTKNEKECVSFRQRCLDNPAQPAWNKETFGDKKDCGACFRECMKSAKGDWPHYKCPER